MSIASDHPIGHLGEGSDDREPHRDAEHRPTGTTFAEHRGNGGGAARHLAIGPDTVHGRRCGIGGDADGRQISCLERFEPDVAAA